jgi:hypothetical protein
MLTVTIPRPEVPEEEESPFPQAKIPIPARNMLDTKKKTLNRWFIVVRFKREIA